MNTWNKKRARTEYLKHRQRESTAKIAEMELGHDLVMEHVEPEIAFILANGTHSVSTGTVNFHTSMMTVPQIDMAFLVLDVLAYDTEFELQIIRERNRLINKARAILNEELHYRSMLAKKAEKK